MKLTIWRSVRSRIAALPRPPGGTGALRLVALALIALAILLVLAAILVGETRPAGAPTGTPGQSTFAAIAPSLTAAPTVTPSASPTAPASPSPTVEPTVEPTPAAALCLPTDQDACVYNPETPTV